MTLPPVSEVCLSSFCPGVRSAVGPFFASRTFSLPCFVSVRRSGRVRLPLGSSKVTCFPLIFSPAATASFSDNFSPALPLLTAAIPPFTIFDPSVFPISSIPTLKPFFIPASRKPLPPIDIILNPASSPFATMPINPTGDSQSFWANVSCIVINW